MKDPVIIEDNGKVCLSTKTRWNLVYDKSFWASVVPEKFPVMLERTRFANNWINVWEIPAQEQPVKINDFWFVRRMDDEYFSGVIQYVSFMYKDAQYALEWPFYYRGSDDRLVKVTSRSPFYDDTWPYYDNGMLFSLGDVIESWYDMYRKFASDKVMDTLDMMSARLDWQGQIARLIARLVREYKYLDAAEVACCAETRSNDHREHEDAKTFEEVAVYLFALDKLE